jgi:hypothetical protein
MFEFMKKVAKNIAKWKKFAKIKRVPSQPTPL